MATMIYHPGTGTLINASECVVLRGLTDEQIDRADSEEIGAYVAEHAPMTVFDIVGQWARSRGL